MTTVDVTYSLAELPREASMIALASLRKVYGVRRIQVDEQSRAVSVEFDATRLSEPVVRQLLRRAGLTLSAPASPEALPEADTIPAGQV